MDAESTKGRAHRRIARGGENCGKTPDDAKRAEASGEAGRLLRRCFACEEMDDGVVPDACVLNSLLAACGRAAAAEDLSADALSKAFALYEEMETSRITCDAYTYASLTRVRERRRRGSRWSCMRSVG